MKIKEILKKGIEETNNKQDEILKVKLLLSNILGVSKEYLFIHEDEEISSDKVEEFIFKLGRLNKNEPIQYIINSQEFMGFDFYVDENVLIPQPDTEILVEEVITLANKLKKSKIKILDMCTGSGAIAVSLSKLIENSEVVASDISDAALKIAIKNAKDNDTEIEFIKSDLFEEFPKDMKFDIIATNPPYIKSNVISTLSEEVKKEPIIALDGGDDGLVFYKKISQKAKEYLKKDGYLIFEIGYDQKLEVEKILKDNEYKNIYSKKDYGENDRIVVAQK